MRPTVAHVNYSFFHSTQSFIYFYLSRLRRVKVICLTRDRESTAIRAEIPAELADDFYVYAGRRGARQTTLWSSGLALRRLLTRLPPRVADPALSLLHGRIVPRMRSDADRAPSSNGRRGSCTAAARRSSTPTSAPLPGGCSS